MINTRKEAKREIEVAVERRETEKSQKYTERWYIRFYPIIYYFEVTSSLTKFQGKLIKIAKSIDFN